MTTRIRHQSPPTPSGCRWCGVEQHHHGRSWVRSVGMHGWEQPTRAQVIARMKARRAARVTLAETSQCGWRLGLCAGCPQCDATQAGEAS